MLSWLGCLGQIERVQAPDLLVASALINHTIHTYQQLVCSPLMEAIELVPGEYAVIGFKAE